MGILILVVLVVGLATIVLYARDIVMWMYRKAFGLPERAFGFPAESDGARIGIDAMPMKQGIPAMQPMAGDAVYPANTTGASFKVEAISTPTIRAQEKGKVPAPKFVGRYTNGSTPELTPWDDLPQYNGATGWFGLAKYRDVVVPNNHHYPSVAYMDTTVKQYFYDVMAGWKDTGEHFQKMGRVKAWASMLVWPIALAICGMNLVALSVIVTLLVLLAVFLFAPKGMRAGRRSAEGSRSLTPADWREVYREVAESQSRVDEMRRAGIGRRYIRGKHP
uniref:Uncharacterized protein n=1 Tax=mine drainage metagenome TaxID=410659 RepID=E6QXC4_9ZZZZ